MSSAVSPSIGGGKSAVMAELEAVLTISDATRTALTKLTIRELLSLIKDVEKSVTFPTD